VGKLSNQSETKPIAHKLFSEDWGKEPEPKLGTKPIWEIVIHQKNLWN